MKKPIVPVVKTCLCGCGKTFQTKRPKQAKYAPGHRNRAWHRAHPRQKIGVLTEAVIGRRRYRLVDLGPA